MLLAFTILELSHRLLISFSRALTGGSLVRFPGLSMLTTDCATYSLHATFLRNRIISAVRDSPSPEARQAIARITQNFVYEHPTLRGLAHTISALLCTANENSLGPDDAPHSTNISIIEQLLERYSSGLPTTTSHHQPISDFSSDIVVLLTGSTGALGSHILAVLLEEPRVSKIYTLNRVDNASLHGKADRQESMFQTLRLPTDLLCKIGRAHV